VLRVSSFVVPVIVVMEAPVVVLASNPGVVVVVETNTVAAVTIVDVEASVVEAVETVVEAVVAVETVVVEVVFTVTAVLVEFTEVELVVIVIFAELDNMVNMEYSVVILASSVVWTLFMEVKDELREEIWLEEHGDVAFMDEMLVAFAVIVALLARLSMLVREARQEA